MLTFINTVAEISFPFVMFFNGLCVGVAWSDWFTEKFNKWFGPDDDDKRGGKK